MIGAVVVALLGLSAAVTGLVSPVRDAPAVADPRLVVTRAAVCPVLSGSGELVGGLDQVTVKDLAGAPVADPGAEGAIKSPIVVSGSGLLPAGVSIGNSGGRTWAACSEPGPGTSVQFAKPSQGELVLVNPDRTDAVVNLSIQSAEGDITTAGSRGLAVAAGSTRVVPISVLAPIDQPVTVVQQSTQGRVLMVARPLGKAAQQVPGQVAATTAVLAGLPADLRTVQVVIGNPGTTEATVQVQALGSRGAFTPSGGESITVEAGATISVDLTSGVNSEAVALKLTSDQPIVSTAVVQTSRDSAWITPTATATSFSDVAAGPALQLANLGQAPATVQVVVGTGKPVNLSIPAGAIASTPTTPGQAVRITSNQPLAAASALITGGLAVQNIRPVPSAGQAGQTQEDPRLR